MKNVFGLKIIVPGLVLGIALAAPVFAQEDNVPASQSMNQAGASAEECGVGYGSGNQACVSWHRDRAVGYRDHRKGQNCLA